MKGGRNGQHHGPLAPLACGDGRGTLDRGLVAGNNHLAGPIVVRDLANLALGRFLDDGGCGSSSTPIRAAMAPVPTGTACCIARPRMRSRRAASASESEPAAASAEYSPSE